MCEICKYTGLIIQLTKDKNPYYSIGTCSCEIGSKVIEHTMSHVGGKTDSFGTWICDCDSPYRSVYYYWTRQPHMGRPEG